MILIFIYLYLKVIVTNINNNMTIVVLMVIFLAIGIIGTIIKSEMRVPGFMFFVVTFLGFIIGNTALYQSQIGDIESLNVIDEEIGIYQERSDEIKSQIKEVLIDKYPEHEKDIMKSLSGNEASIYLVKYPELHAHETFKQYTEILVSLDKKIYDQKLKKVDLKKNISERRRNPWIIGQILPTK